MWEGGLGPVVPPEEAVLVHAGLQPGQTLQHPLQQRAPPSPFTLWRDLQRSAPWEHDVYFHSQELVADDLSFHTRQTFHKVYGKRKNRL